MYCDSVPDAETGDSSLRLVADGSVVCFEGKHLWVTFVGAVTCFMFVATPFMLLRVLRKLFLRPSAHRAQSTQRDDSCTAIVPIGRQSQGDNVNDDREVPRHQQSSNLRRWGFFYRGLRPEGYWFRLTHYAFAWVSGWKVAR